MGARTEPIASSGWGRFRWSKGVPDAGAWEPWQLQCHTTGGKTDMSMNLDYADGWRPEEGDTLIGTITDVSVGVSSVNGASYPIITVQPESGGDPVAVHGFHAGLFNRLTELRPRTGERIGFQFKGKRPHKTQPGKEVAVYAVKVDRPDGGGDDVWNRLDAPAQQPAPVTPQQRATDAPVTAQDFSAVDTSGDDDIPF